MGRLAYLDCFSGVSGDMLLGAIIDCGVSVGDLRGELAKLRLDGYNLSATRVTRSGLAATQAVVEVAGAPAPRTLGDVLGIIDRSSLPHEDREKAARIFQRLAEAEAKVHAETVEAVHLHDVGAVDAIVDVMGTLAGLRLLDVHEVFASPLPAGAGAVDGPHGKLPVPAPATLELLSRANAPLRPADGASGELVTPTGAAILTTVARFERPAMTLERAGYGAGSREIEGRPNVLRIWLGERIERGVRQMVLIETNIDDMTGEMLGYARDTLLDAGAADVWFTSVQMKKGRPGVMLSVICKSSALRASPQPSPPNTRPANGWRKPRASLSPRSIGSCRQNGCPDCRGAGSLRRAVILSEDHTCSRNPYLREGLPAVEGIWRFSGV